MKSKSVRILSLFVVLLILISMRNLVFASEVRLDHLDFNVVIDEFGNMDVTETWNAYIEDTNTLFKTFNYDGSFESIEDVYVVETTDNKNTTFMQSDEYQYHVDENYFQALTNPDGAFEIAWGVNESGSDYRDFVIHYKVKNNVAIYNDCAELYWKFVGDDFDVYSKNVTGIIKLPDGVPAEEDYRVWAHGPLNGTIVKDSNNQVSFTVDGLSRKTFLEVRLAMPQGVFDSVHRYNEDRLDTILAEEQEYADEANRIRARVAFWDKVISIGVSAIMLLGSYFGCRFFLKTSAKKNEIKAKVPTIKYDYFRDIPDLKASPAEAGYLYYFGKGGIDNNPGHIYAATLMDLALKGCIEFEIKAKDKDSIIHLKENGKENELTEDEKIVFGVLKKINNGEDFTFSKMKNYSSTKLETMFEQLSKSTKSQMKAKGNFSDADQKEKDEYTGSMVLCLTLWFFSFGAFIYSFIPTLLFQAVMLLLALQSYLISKKLSGLTQKGIDEQNQWQGLKKYMKEFSLLKDKEIPDLILWEHYLVYATAFGISKQVIKQLKVYFPELNDDEYVRSHYPCMQVMTNDHFSSYFSNSNNWSSVGNTGNYSSASGSGGGFSSGGGGGRRRWRRRWSLITKKLI